MSNKLSRRAFLQLTSLGLGSTLLPLSAWGSAADDLVDGKRILYLEEARYYKKLEDDEIECELCPHRCVIGDCERGICGVRENVEGTYYTLVYGNACSAHIDPIEKKPLFHFLPTTSIFSIATAGCNMRCKFCQNWEISQFRPEQLNQVYDLPPDKLIETIKKNNCTSIAFTYSEPVIFYEYMYDTALLAKENNIHSVMISNGYINPIPMKALCKPLSAVKIDFKAFTDEFYQDICGGTLQPVLDTLVLLKDEGIWFEIVVLIIPTLNDDETEIKDMCKWILKNLGNDIPLHFNRFYPQYTLKNLPPTPISTLNKAYTIARDVGLNYVYIGNNPGNKAENTYCHSCGKLLIGRRGFMVYKNNLKDGCCPYCDTKIPGVWE